jgi:2-enoate reductase
VKLFDPGRIGKVKLKNRIVMSAMGCGGLVQLDGSLSQRGIDYYVARAKGGVGLITTGSCRVTRDFEKIPNNPINSSLMIDNKLYSRWVEELAAGVHDYGAKLSVQLLAGLGRTLSKDDIAKVRPIGPSAIPCFADSNTLTHELTIVEIGRFFDAFEAAAVILKSAKVDAIELNCHAGYLVDQFMTELWNRRTDAYGGNLEGRLRFLLEIIGRIKKVLGKDFPVIVKYALMHYFPGGREAEEGVEIARRLEAAGVDALTIDAGCRETFYWTLPSEFQPEGCTVNLAAMVKNAVKIPVITVGKLGNPQLAEETIQEGKADFVALGRELLADPEWPNKVRAGRFEDVRPCVWCFEGCHRRIHEGKTLSCAVNPATGNERALVILPAEEKKSVLVIGGGPGGMEAARVAALRGHRVSLWENDRELGGNLKPGFAPEFKESYQKLRDYLVLQLKKVGVETTLGKEATPELIDQLNPDVVVVATGSTPVIPPIVGVERRSVVTAVDLLSGREVSGKNVVIIGGGIVGCETALHLARKGGKVTIVELLSGIGRDMYQVNRIHLLKLLNDAGVEVLTESRVLEITETGIVYADEDQQQKVLKADTIVIAVGMKPRSDLAEKLNARPLEVYQVGDCSEPRKVIDAMWEAFRVARYV